MKSKKRLPCSNHEEALNAPTSYKNAAYITPWSLRGAALGGWQANRSPRGKRPRNRGMLGLAAGLVLGLAGASPLGLAFNDCGAA